MQGYYEQALISLGMDADHNVSGHAKKEENEFKLNCMDDPYLLEQEHNSAIRILLKGDVAAAEHTFKAILQRDVSSVSAARNLLYILIKGRRFKEAKLILKVWGELN